MRVPSAPGTSLTYCTNIHPAESWSEVQRVLGTSVRAVKAEVAPDEPFGVGLRLSARACSELVGSDRIEALRLDLERDGLYVVTLNGFPYGQFHATRVKENVYRPDWLEEPRVTYTIELIRVLAALLPENEMGSISTVPGCFKPRLVGSDALAQIAHNLVRVAAELVRVERETGKELCLALEPEPECALETSAQAVAFFEDSLLDARCLAELASAVGVDRREAETLLHRHVGVCLDACHASVEFEPPMHALQRLIAAGLRVPKAQVSAGLVIDRFEPETLARLESFADSTYLHQTVVRTPAGLARFVDITPALETAPRFATDCEWRVHFHVPVFQRVFGPFTSTQQELIELLRSRELLDSVPHLEVETYTFELLPQQYKPSSVVDAIVRELEWTRAELSLPRVAP